MENEKCHCEHSAHFDRDLRTPHGNPSHRYGQAFHPLAMRDASTPYGSFRVCMDCAKDCHCTIEGCEPRDAHR